MSFLTIGCVSEYYADIPPNDTQILFVDGYIVENSDVIFYLSKSFPLHLTTIPNESLNILANLTIIGRNGYKSEPAINLGRGAYKFSVGKLEDNVEYGIQIEYNGDIYQSALSKPLSTPEIDSVSFTQNRDTGTVFFRVSTHDNSGDTKFYLWDYIEDWEITAYYYTQIFFDLASNRFYLTDDAPYYYCWKNLKSNKFLIGSTESLNVNSIVNKQLYSCLPTDTRFSVLYSVIVSQKAISKGAFEYYQNKIVLNDEMGGLFTPQPSEMSGNITCITDPSKKVMGYVEAVKNVTQKRIFISPKDIVRPAIYPNCASITEDSLRNILREFDGTYRDAYDLGFRPIAWTPSNTPSEWSTFHCSECTSYGSKNKPDFWPNDHK